MADEFPPDYTSNIGRVRKYIPDIVLLEDPANPNADPQYMLDDDTIESFINDEVIDDTLTVASYQIWRAAAYAMIAIANNENLILKKIVKEDLETDGPKVAEAMLKAAAALINRANRAELVADDLENEVFLIVPNAFYPSDHRFTNRFVGF